MSPTATKIDHIVLYGSLRAGAPAHRRLGLEDALRLVRQVGVRGQLLDLGDFPGLRLGRPGRVAGDLFRILDPSVLERLDAFEAFDPADAAPYCEEDDTGSLYLRQVLPGRPPAWVYVFNGWTREGRARRFRPIASGDWLAHAAGAA